MMDAVADLVRRAQAGDPRAFAQLIARFQDLAFGYAFRWLGDPESARDAAQDAFISAFLSLEQLKEPAAFAGWFRCVLLKQCDRRTRRLATPTLETDAAAPLPDQELLEQQEHEWLRQAVEELPEHERMVVALHYFGDEPQQDVADFLELPLSTLKKRLFLARRRLEAKRGEMEAHRPSRTPVFADKIELFVAIRSGDTRMANAALQRQPDLIEAKGLWPWEEALCEQLPMPHGVTPLVAAAERGDRAMVELLLTHGARVDHRGGHYSDESALWAAALHGYADVVEVLMAAGADPSAPNRVGHTAMHVAAMHGHDQILELLEKSGGKLDVAAENGMTASDYRRQRSGACRLDGQRLETGIKAVDLFSPLRLGMLVRVRGAARTGLMVLLAELARRWGDSGKRSTFIGSEPMPWQKNELVAFTRESGIEDCTTVLTDGFEHLPAVDDGAFALFVFEQEGRRAQVEAVLPALARRPGLTFLVEPWTAVTRGDSEPAELRAPFDALICTSPALAARGMWPAIDPERTASNAAIEPAHRRIQERARELLRRSGDQAERARAFLTQPFITWQHHSGRPGEVVSLAQTLARMDAILRG